MKKKLIALFIVTALAVSALSACGSSSSDSSDDASETAEEETEETDEADDTEETEEADAETAEEADDTELEVITVAATETPHSEVLAVADELLADYGYTLEVTVFEDYILPNEVVVSGEIDANYFQHVNYLNSYNEENGTSLAIAENGKIHYEPFGIYGGTKSSLDEIEDGDAIAIPNDTTNEARALLLLEQEGLITLADGVGVYATVNDIEDNPYNIEFVEVAAEAVALQLPDVAYAVINGNYALQNGLSVGQDALAVEASDNEAIVDQYVNVIAVNEGNESLDKIVALTTVLHSDEVVSFIESEYDGAVIAYDGEQ